MGLSFHFTISGFFPFSLIEPSLISLFSMALAFSRSSLRALFIALAGQASPPRKIKDVGCGALQRTTPDIFYEIRAAAEGARLAFCCRCGEKMREAHLFTTPTTLFVR